MSKPFFFLAVSLVVLLSLRSDVVAQWTHLNVGQLGAGVPAVSIGGDGGAITGYGTNVFAIIFARESFSSDTLYVSKNGGETWTADTALPNTYIQSLSVIGSEVYSVTNDGIFGSSDSGATWESINGGVMDTTYPTMLVGSGPNLVAVTQDSGAVFLTSDNGLSWKNVGKDLPEVASLTTTGSDIFAGTTDGIYSSTDEGDSWSQLNDTLTNINALVASGGLIFAGRYVWAAPAYLSSPPGALFRSTDNGITWSSFSNGLPSYFGRGPQLYTLALHGDDVYAGLDSGVYGCNINYDNWYNDSGGLPITSVYSIYISDSSIFVGTESDGIWERPVSQLTSLRGEIGPGVPRTFRLLQNFPNPFNPSTTISYQLSAVRFVTLRIYDALGRKVTTLVDGKQNPGYYNVTFDASNLPSGVYFCRLEVAGKNLVRKMTLIK